MKKILLTAALLLASFGVSAQLHVDLRAGASAASFGDRHLKLGLRTGIGVEYLFGRFGIRTGLFYTNKGASTTSNVFDYDRSIRLSYLDIPVEAVGSFPLAGRTRIEVHAGPYAACRVRSVLPEGMHYDAKHCEFGAGAGVDFAIGRFIVGPEVQYGLTRLAKRGDDHATTYALTLGYRF